MTNPYSKTRGFHCWWLNKNDKALAHFDNESDVDGIIKLNNDKKKLQKQISKAISCVHNSHEDDTGYDVLCALGENP